MNDEFDDALSRTDTRYTPEARAIWEITADHFGLPYNYPNKMARSDAFLGMEISDDEAKYLIRQVIQNVRGVIRPEHFAILADRDANATLVALISFFTHDHPENTGDRNAALLASMIIFQAAADQNNRSKAVFEELIALIKPDEKTMEFLSHFEMDENTKVDITDDVIKMFNEEYAHDPRPETRKEDSIH